MGYIIGPRGPEHLGLSRHGLNIDPAPAREVQGVRHVVYDRVCSTHVDKYSSLDKFRQSVQDDIFLILGVGNQHDGCDSCGLPGPH